MNSVIKNLDSEKLEQIERGKRIKNIRENELHFNKTRLAKEIGISGNLVYRSVKKLMDLSGHSADYILFGLDDNIINETKKCLGNYSETQIKNALDTIKDISLFIKNM